MVKHVWFLRFRVLNSFLFHFIGLDGFFVEYQKKFARVKIVVSYVVLKAKFMLSGKLGYQSLISLELEMWHYFLHFLYNFIMQLQFSIVILSN